MENQEHINGPGVCLILLDKISFSIPQFLTDLKEEWDIELPEQDYDKEKNMLVTTVLAQEEAMVSVALMPAPIPVESVVENAKTNFRWPEAVDVAQLHKAHLVIAVIAEKHPLESNTLLVKLCATALRQQHAVGINTVGTVFSPEFYRAAAKAYLDNKQFPIMNLVFFGIYSKDNGQTFCGYTYGLNNFGKKELEILDTHHTHEELLDFLISVAEYIIVQNVRLQHGETIGFSEDERLQIIESSGQALDEITLKIGF